MAALFIIARNWEQPGLLTGGQTNYGEFIQWDIAQ